MIWMALFTALIGGICAAILAWAIQGWSHELDLYEADLDAWRKEQEEWKVKWEPSARWKVMEQQFEAKGGLDDQEFLVVLEELPQIPDRCRRES
jgi:hypothetical protein